MIPLKTCDQFVGQTNMGRCSILDVGVNREVVCRSCQQHGEPTRDNPYLRELVKSKSIRNRVADLASSLMQMTGLADRKTIVIRASICNQCEMLEDKPVLGKMCKACGCSILKIQLKGMVCPLGKW